MINNIFLIIFICAVLKDAIDKTISVVTLMMLPFTAMQKIGGILLAGVMFILNTAVICVMLTFFNFIIHCVISLF